MSSDWLLDTKATLSTADFTNTIISVLKVVNCFSKVTLIVVEPFQSIVRKSGRLRFSYFDM